MKIADAQAIPLAIPPKDGRIPWIWGAFNQVIVEIKTDEGLVGWGEAFGYGQPLAAAAMVNHTLRPLLIGRDPADIRGIVDALYRKTHLFGRYGVTIFGISGVEIALWDLAGKRAGQPLYRLLGGAESREVKAYASLVRYADREQMGEHAARALKEGYEMIKLHQIDVESVRAAREAIGDGVPLTVDINCEWTPSHAAQMAMAMDEYDLFWLEEPVWPPEDYAGLAEVNEATGVPLASGENACTAHQFKLMMEARAVTYPQPSVIKVGGIAEFLKIATLAEAYNLSLAPHSPYFGPGFLATLHLLAHTRQARWIEKLYIELEHPIFIRPIPLQNATYTVPDAPGLGLEVDPGVLKRYRMKEG
jgi:L-alanine-DL-glutamate epimerase-like enolase superfamily enzyme